jgi:alcohol dehydrogenase (cytochrome c)
VKLLRILVLVAVALALAPATRPAHAATTVDWPSYNNDLASRRFAMVTQIDKSNVARLHVLCTVDLDDPTRYEAGPVVVNGILYATTRDDTYALDARTCATNWMNHYGVDTVAASRGVAYANGMVFRGYRDGTIAGIDAATGQTVWNVSITGGDLSQYVSGAPIAWRGALFIGTSGSDIGGQGHIFALDQKTGAQLWTFKTVPNPGDPLAKTWQGATIIAGGSTWSSFALDSANGTLWVPTANPGPDYNDSERGGANLWSDSLLELNATTGVLLHAYQLVQHDFHDWDIAATPVLANVAGGKTVVLAAGKDGFARGIDPLGHSVLWQTAVARRENDDEPIEPTGTHFCPGVLGGVSYNGPAYFPPVNMLFVHSIDWCTTVKLRPGFPKWDPPNDWTGGTSKQDAQENGNVVALDASSGAVRWTRRMDAPLLAGLTVTASGLLLTADLDGNIFALDAATGKILRTIPTGLPVGGGVVAYAVAGKEYVAVAAGMTSQLLWKTHAKAARIIVLGL